MAELSRKDWVKDQTQTAGTGAVVLDGVAPSGGFVTYAAALVNGRRYRNIIYQSSTGAVEVSEGVWTSATSTMSRDRVFFPVSGALVSFAAGIKEMWVGPCDVDFDVPEFATGTAIASAATINLDTATGGRVHVTGVTGITAITLTRGPRTVIFDGSLLLTHNATTLNLPGGANIQTRAGDRAVFEGDGTTVYCVSYMPASGGSPVPDSISYSARTANTMLGAKDQGWFIDITANTFAQTFDTPANLGDGWWAYIRNSGSGSITLTPSSGLIDGLSSFVMYPDEVRLLECNASALRSFVIQPFYTSSAATLSFVWPPGYNVIDSDLTAAGGGGGSGSTGASNVASGGGAGGAGGRGRRRFAGIAPGTVVTVTVGAAGTGGAAVTANSTNGNNGTAGGNTSFGTMATVYGGAPGQGGVTSTGGAGGGGGGSTSAPSGSTGGGPNGDEGGANAGGNAIWGGAGGAAQPNGINGGTAGGSSQFGPGAGGSGGSINSTTFYGGGAGGLHGAYVAGGGAAAGSAQSVGAQAANPVGANGAAAANDYKAGDGGGGGGGCQYGVPVYSAVGSLSSSGTGTTIAPGVATVPAGGCSLALVVSKNNFVHTCNDANWVLVSQVNSGASFTMSVWQNPLATPGTPTFTVGSTSVANEAVVLSYGPIGAGTGVGATSSNSGTGTAASCPTITTTSNNSTAVVLVADALSSNQPSTPSGWSSNTNGSSPGAAISFGAFSALVATGGSASPAFSSTITSSAWVAITVELESYTPTPGDGGNGGYPGGGGAGGGGSSNGVNSGKGGNGGGGRVILWGAA